MYEEDAPPLEGGSPRHAVVGATTLSLVDVKKYGADALMLDPIGSGRVYAIVTLQQAAKS